MEKIKYITVLLLLPSVLLASDPIDMIEPINHKIFDRDVIEYHAGSFLENIYAKTDNNYSNTVSRKSPLLAAFMSAAVPGAGEVYAGRWWRGLAHFGLEVTAWYFYLHYDHRGDKQTAFFENYADTHWSVVDYVIWLNEYWGGDISYLTDESLPPWERVDWGEINEFERSIPQFSHTLEPYGTQQYYELIGKYPQYNRGWKDSEPHEDVDLETGTGVANPGLYFTEVSDMFRFYSGERGYANTLYARAHTAAIAVFLNHFISAFHAAFLAHSFNHTHLAIDIENRDDIYGDRLVPVLKLQVGF